MAKFETATRFTRIFPADLKEAKAQIKTKTRRTTVPEIIQEWRQAYEILKRNNAPQL